MPMIHFTDLNTSETYFQVFATRADAEKARSDLRRQLQAGVPISVSVINEKTRAKTTLEVDQSVQFIDYDHDPL
ncbi:hypothetical protein [Actinomyces minihominis]|uniref:hypothetical protein n=1 Tax=Actinomyces minihominis TaxID=2002838 RepID=UPI0013ED975E|nr:hypothetical protein [Actinomyces minihominis]